MPVTNNPPENPELLEVEVKLAQRGELAAVRCVNCLDHKLQTVEREPVHTFAKRKTVALGHACGAVKSPGHKID